MMRKALALFQPGQYEIAARILAQAGALYLHSNLTTVRFYWQRGYDLMKVCHNQRFLAEFSINTGHLVILESRFESAAYFNKALKDSLLGEHFRRTWRIHANLATVCEIQGDINKAARSKLRRVLREVRRLKGTSIPGIFPAGSR
jgi:hypothetical protein